MQPGPTGTELGQPLQSDNADFAQPRLALLLVFLLLVHGRNRLRNGKVSPVPTRRVPRVAKLMAPGIRFDGLIRDGVVDDQAELARLGHVTNPRWLAVAGAKPQ